MLVLFAFDASAFFGRGDSLLQWSNTFGCGVVYDEIVPRERSLLN